MPLTASTFVTPSLAATLGFTSLVSGGVFSDVFLSLDDNQWRPSASTGVYLTPGTYRLTPEENPGGVGEGLNAFFTGGMWNSWYWRVAVWDSQDDSTANRVAYFSTENHGSPIGFATDGADEAFQAALSGERSLDSTGYPSQSNYEFQIIASGIYYFGVFDEDQTNNTGEVFATLSQTTGAVPSPGGAVALAAIGLSRRRRSR